MSILKQCAIILESKVLSSLALYLYTDKEDQVASCCEGHSSRPCTGCDSSFSSQAIESSCHSLRQPWTFSPDKTRKGAPTKSEIAPNPKLPKTSENLQFILLHFFYFEKSVPKVMNLPRPRRKQDKRSWWALHSPSKLQWDRMRSEGGVARNPIKACNFHFTMFARGSQSYSTVIICLFRLICF